MTASVQIDRSPTHWAIAIGIGQYPFLPPLVYAESDAVALARAWTERPDLGGSNCLLLSDRSAPALQRPTYPNRENLEYWLDRVCGELVQPGDLLWVFFNGYGAADRDQDYLLPVEGDLERLSSSALPVRRVYDALKVARDRAGDGSVLLLLDTNHPRDGYGTAEFGMEARNLAREYEIPTILANEPGQLSQISATAGAGLFSAALAQAVRSPAVGNLYSLEREIRSAMGDLAARDRLQPQQPVTIAYPQNRLYQTVLRQTVEPKPSYIAFPVSAQDEASTLAEPGASPEPTSSDTPGLDLPPTGGDRAISFDIGSDPGTSPAWSSPDLAEIPASLALPELPDTTLVADPGAPTAWTPEASVSPNLANEDAAWDTIAFGSDPAATDPSQPADQGAFEALGGPLPIQTGPDGAPGDSPEPGALPIGPTPFDGLIPIDEPGMIGADLASGLTGSGPVSDFPAEADDHWASHWDDQPTGAGSIAAETSSTPVPQPVRPGASTEPATALGAGGAGGGAIAPTHDPATDGGQGFWAKIGTYAALGFVILLAGVALRQCTETDQAARESAQLNQPGSTAAPGTNEIDGEARPQPVPVPSEPPLTFTSPTGQPQPTVSASLPGQGLFGQIPTPEASNQPAPAPAPGNGPVAAPGAAGTATPKPAQPAPANPPASPPPGQGTSVGANDTAILNQARAAIDRSQPDQALALINGLPAASQATDQAKALRAEAQQLLSSGILGEARIPLGSNQASEFNRAITRARSVKPGDPLYAQAQKDITRWSQVMLDLARGRAQSGDYGGAIAAAKLVPTDQGSIYQEAQRVIPAWAQRQQQQAATRKVLADATAQLKPNQASSYNRAIDLVSVVRPDQDGYPLVRSQVDAWSQEILKLAQARAKAGQVAQAIATAKLVPPNTAAHGPAQAELAKWQKP